VGFQASVITRYFQAVRGCFYRGGEKSRPYAGFIIYRLGLTVGGAAATTWAMSETSFTLPSGPSIFISDVHLQKPCGKGYRRICGFLERFDSDAGSLVIVGDLFDFWIGDNWLLAFVFRRLFRALDAIKARGVAICYLEGNHDFLLGPRIRRRLGLAVFEADAWLTLGSTTIYAAHGDLANPEDVGYLKLRKIFRGRLVRILSRALPDPIIAAIGGMLSLLSRRYTDWRGDNSEGPFRDLALEKIGGGADYVVLGHSHAALRNRLEAGGRHGYYVNLGDWLFKFTYLRIEPDGKSTLLEFNPD
jgi:UDP-2,3-diacylglucosamine hydrolase